MRRSKSPVGLYPVGLYIVEPERRAYARVRIVSLSLQRCCRLFSTAGCAYQLDTAFSKADADVEQTGSIARPDRQVTAANVVAPSETDLAYARAVAADVVGHGAKDASIPWENPNTGAGGNITPLAASYSEGSHRPRFSGELCARAGAGLVAGRSLPLGARQMGSQEPAAVQTGLSEPAFSAPLLIQWIAGRFLKSHINESNSIGRRAGPKNRTESMGDAGSL